MYDIIRQNFLVGNSGSMTEEERQANISLGMKKAEYALSMTLLPCSSVVLNSYFTRVSFLYAPLPYEGIF